jgi:N-acetylmuramoyl-L-alanine amidase
MFFFLSAVSVVLPASLSGAPGYGFGGLQEPLSAPGQGRVLARPGWAGEIGHATPTKRKTHKAAPGPSTIQDIRITAYPEYTRLVFDLQRQVTFTQHRQKKPHRLIIELQNALLGKVAKARLAEGSLPADITIAQTAAHSVALSLDLEAVSDYKLLPLQKPSRLVVDLYTKAPAAETAAAAPVTADAPGVPPGPVRKSIRRDIHTVVIDPGHGGKDPGAIGRNGSAEKDITLKVGLLLKQMLADRLGTQVIMTRERDVFLELEERTTFANRNNADLFVSIHVNSHGQRGIRGVEVYHFGEASDPRALAVAARENGTPIENTGVGWQYLVADLLTSKKMEESLELAWSAKQALVSELNPQYEVVDHGVKTGPFYVLRFTAMPSILAEIAFISNPTEERLMQSPAFLKRIAEGIFEGIKAFIAPAQSADRGSYQGPGERDGGAKNTGIN